MDPLPPYTGDTPEDTTLTTGNKIVLLVLALVILHLIALVRPSIVLPIPIHVYHNYKSF